MSVTIYTMGTHTLLLLVCLVAGLHLSMAQGPSPPTALTVTSVRYNNISISWKDAGSGDYYFLSVNSNNWNFTAHNNNETITMYYAVQPTYTYHITLNAVLDGVPSTAVTKRFVAAFPVPKIESLSEEKEGTLNIKWTQEGEVTAFNIHIKSDDNRIQDLIDLTASAPASGSYKGNYSVAVRSGYRYNVSITAFFGLSPSESSVTQTFIAAGEKQEDNSTVSPGTFIQCYMCNAINCGTARTSTDVKEDCPKTHACWMRRLTNTIIRRCEPTACSSEFQKWKCETKNSAETCSKCCTGDACNGELVTSSSRLVLADFPLMISSMFMVLTSLFIMA